MKFIFFLDNVSDEKAPLTFRKVDREVASENVVMFEVENVEDGAQSKAEKMIVDVDEGTTNVENQKKEDREQSPIQYESVLKLTFPPKSSSSNLTNRDSPDIKIPVGRRRAPRRSSINSEPVYKDATPSSEEEASDEEYTLDESENDEEVEEMSKDELGKIMSNSSDLPVNNHIPYLPSFPSSILVASFSVLKVFNTEVAAGQLPPLLDCQQSGGRKVPLTTEGVKAKNLFVDGRELSNHRDGCDNAKHGGAKYLRRLTNDVLGDVGWNFIFQIEDMRRSYKGKESIKHEKMLLINISVVKLRQTNLSFNELFL